MAAKYLFAVQEAAVVYRLPASLKLSVHSGSDKFSIDPAIHRGRKRHGVDRGCF